MNKPSNNDNKFDKPWEFDTRILTMIDNID
jgi:hypothetical protein